MMFDLVTNRQIRASPEGLPPSKSNPNSPHMSDSLTLNISINIFDITINIFDITINIFAISINIVS